MPSIGGIDNSRTKDRDLEDVTSLISVDIGGTKSSSTLKSTAIKTALQGTFNIMVIAYCMLVYSRSTCMYCFCIARALCGCALKSYFVDACIHVYDIECLLLCPVGV